MLSFIQFLSVEIPETASQIGRTIRQTDASHAYLVAERVRKALTEVNLLNNAYVVTASFGISQLKTGESVETFINRADIALYRAKQSGRNRSILAE
jgi:diguanylate cyclase (GGDEF)-like protein